MKEVFSMADHASARFKGPRSSSRALAAFVAVLLLWGLGLASAAVDKNASYQEMIGLAQQMQTLKPQIRSNASAAAAYAVAENRYQALSAALGGDDPGHIGNGAGAAAAQAAPTRVVPTTPAGCGQATATFTQSTPVAIPAGPAVVTSTVVVSGAGPYLFDLDLTTFITHTFPGDIDMTLTSPAGTVVTITTDNAGTNDDVFNGTVWDDDANPAGQVPYTTNNGLVTDQLYAVGVLASPLVPEEAMGAFIGEDPNGTWTITISDDAAGDSGNLNSWTLGVTTFPNAPITTTEPTATQSTPVAIPAGPAVVTSTLVVAGAGTSILDLDLTTFITHTFPGDIDMTLTSPAGTVVTITTDNGGTNDDVFNGTVWDDDANPAGQVPYTTNNGLVTDQLYAVGVLASPLVPEEAMGAFIGEDPNGTWTITISDDAAGDSGNLNSWTLGVTTFPNAPITTTEPTATQSTPVAIPAGPAVVTSTLVVAGAGTSILDLDLTTFITHTFPGDIDMTLTSPAGTVVTITTDNGGTNDDVFNGTVWDDDANPAGQVPYTTNNGLVTDQLYAVGVLASPLVPEEAMAAFIGEDPNGTWTLTISDDAAGDGGNLNSWTLGVTTFPNAPITTTEPTATQSTPVAIPAGPAVVTSTL